MAKKSIGTTLTLYMTFVVLAGFAVILVMNMVAFLGVIPSKYLSPNEVRGIAVEHNHKLYTLNFDQQNALVDILNRLFPVGQEIVDKRKVEVPDAPKITKIIIYRFNAPDLEIIPVAYISKTTSVMTTPDISDARMVLSIPEWNQNGLLEESSSDELQKLLSSTYGP